MPELLVLLEGREVGVLSSGSTPTLRFDPSHVGDPSSTPLSLSMRRDVAQRGDPLLNWLWGLLPDDERVVEKWATAFDVSSRSPVELLSTPVGLDCAGAVQFVSMKDIGSLVDRDYRLEALSEADLAGRLSELVKDATAWNAPGRTGQFSLAGAQRKLALHRDAQGQWHEPHGRAPTTHILKPAIADLAWQDLNEHLSLTSAAHLGLSTTRSEFLVLDDSLTAIVAERYDRLWSGDGTKLTRVHQEDFCQALSVSPRRKYEHDGGPTARDLVSVLRSNLEPESANVDVWRFIDALIFNWLILGTDAHAKNYSLLLRGSERRMAPLYDVASFLPYDDSAGHRVKLAMKIGGEYNISRMDRRSAWEKAAQQFEVPTEALITRALDLAAGVGASYARAVEGTEIPRPAAAFADELVELVDARARLCRTVLERPSTEPLRGRARAEAQRVHPDTSVSPVSQASDNNRVEFELFLTDPVPHDDLPYLDTWSIRMRLVRAIDQSYYQFLIARWPKPEFDGQYGQVSHAWERALTAAIDGCSEWLRGPQDGEVDPTAAVVLDSLHFDQDTPRASERLDAPVASLHGPDLQST